MKEKTKTKIVLGSLLATEALGIFTLLALRLDWIWYLALFVERSDAVIAGTVWVVVPLLAWFPVKGSLAHDERDAGPS